MASLSFPLSPSLPQSSKFLYSSPPSMRRKPISPVSSSLKLGIEEIALITHNKALVAATVASAIGQLAKPLSSRLLGDGVSLRSLVQPGGMPSTHSASVVAAATSVGLERAACRIEGAVLVRPCSRGDFIGSSGSGASIMEDRMSVRGFSDSVFGMSVVFAALVMYDAQGVRKEAGNHAKVLNRILKAEEASINSKAGTSSLNTRESFPLVTLSEKANAYTSDSEPYSLQESQLTSRSAMPSLKVDTKEISENIYSNYTPLTERLGHTLLEVFVGALLGFVVSLTVGVIL